ncbi:hypothetical protein ACJX0J_014649, partial [Zea mays]
MLESLGVVNKSLWKEAHIEPFHLDLVNTQDWLKFSCSVITDDYWSLAFICLYTLYEDTNYFLFSECYISKT